MTAPARVAIGLITAAGNKSAEDVLMADLTREDLALVAMALARMFRQYADSVDAATGNPGGIDGALRTAALQLVGGE